MLQKMFNLISIYIDNDIEMGYNTRVKKYLEVPNTMKKTIAILMSILMLAIMAVPAMAADTACPECKMNTYIFYMTVTPNCTEDGYTLWKCNNSECGYEGKYDVVPALGHSFPVEYDHVDGGCLKETYDHRYCAVCGAEDKINVVKAPGHKWDEGVFVPAGCEIADHYVHTCATCQATKIEKKLGGAPYTGHDMVLISSPQTCLDEAVNVYECKNCGKIDNIATSPVDHVDEDADGYCDICEADIALEEEPHGFYAQIIKWISEIVEAIKAFIASIKG